MALLPELAQVHLWLDTDRQDFPIKEIKKNIQIYRPLGAVAPILTLNIPASETSDLERRLDPPPGKPPFRIRRRGYSKYYVNSAGNLAERDEIRELSYSYAKGSPSDTKNIIAANWPDPDEPQTEAFRRTVNIMRIG